MACLSIAFDDIASGCKDNAGGVKVVFIMDRNNIDFTTGITYSVSGESKYEITGITLKDNTKKFSKWKFRKATANLTSTATISEETGGASFQNDLALVFGKQESQKRLQMMAAVYNDAVVVVKDYNDKYHFLGIDAEVTASALTAETGTAVGDRNGYSLTLSDTSKELPLQINMAAADLTSIGIDE